MCIFIFYFVTQLLLFQQAKDLLNPPENTSLQQKLQENSESVYASTQRAPLGRSHDQRPNLPPFCDDKTTYGSVTSRGQ